MRDHQHLPGTIMTTNRSAYQSYASRSSVKNNWGHSQPWARRVWHPSVSMCVVCGVCLALWIPHMETFKCNFIFLPQCLFSSWRKPYIPIKKFSTVSLLNLMSLLPSPLSFYHRHGTHEIKCIQTWSPNQGWRDGSAIKGKAHNRKEENGDRVQVWHASFIHLEVN